MICSCIAHCLMVLFVIVNYLVSRFFHVAYLYNNKKRSIQASFDCLYIFTKDRISRYFFLTFLATFVRS